MTNEELPPMSTDDTDKKTIDGFVLRLYLGYWYFTVTSNRLYREMSILLNAKGYLSDRFLKMFHPSAFADQRLRKFELTDINPIGALGVHRWYSFNYARKL